MTDRAVDLIASLSFASDGSRHGFTLLRCMDCPAWRVVPFTCKGRGFCPSCGGRQMNQQAAHLMDRVFPDVPVRQWVLKLPFPLRVRMAWDIELRKAVHGVYRRVVFGWYRRRAMTLLGVPDGECGSVTFVQNFGSSLNLNVHFHMLVLDGVYAWEEGGGLVFHRVPAPSDVEVQEIVDEVAQRVLRLMKRRGLVDDDEEASEDGQLLMMTASGAGRAALGLRAGRRPRVLRGPPQPRSLPRRCASAGWFNLHAGVSVGGQDREALERLIRYTARPPIALDRLQEREDGRVVVRFKRPWSDGTSALVLTGVELLERLAALVPRKRACRVLYGGILAPAAAWRHLVVPKPSKRASASGCKHGSSQRYVSWRDLLWRVFGVDPFICQHCQGKMRVHAGTGSRTNDCFALMAAAARATPSRSRIHYRS